MTNTVSIWKDTIILKWDGQIGTANPDAVKTPQDMLHFWEHIGNHAKWNQKLGAFRLNFSKQNMKRIHAQFGEISITSGADMVRRLKQKQEELYNMVKTAETIKYAPYEKLPQYPYKVPPLGEYQHRATVMACNVRRFPLFADPGLGKTKIILDSIQRHKDLNVVQQGKTLITVKLPTIRSGWMEDVKKFTDLKLVNLWIPQCKNRKEKILELLNQPADAYVINHEGVLVMYNELIDRRFQKVIIDESTILKGYHGDHAAIKGGQFGRAIKMVSHWADWRVIMTGTPAPNGPMDLWGQFYFLDPDGLLLEPSFTDYREDVMLPIDMRPRSKQFRRNEAGELIHIPRRPKDPQKWVPRKDSFTKVGNVINPLAFRARIRDHLKDLPELTSITRTIYMDHEQRRHYDTMFNRLLVEIDEERISVELAITKVMKLRQITGGFIIDHKEEPHPLPSNPKLSEMDDILRSEIPLEDKVVIYAQYQYEVETLENRYKDLGVVTVYGGNSSKKNLDNIDKFIKDPKVKIIILHPKSMAHGVTFTVAHYMIFYSISHSAEDNFQCRARIERAGQKHPMIIYYLLCYDSVDEEIYDIVIQKDKDQSAIIDPDTELLKTWRKNASTTGKNQNLPKQVQGTT